MKSAFTVGLLFAGSACGKLLAVNDPTLTVGNVLIGEPTINVDALDSLIGDQTIAVDPIGVDLFQNVLEQPVGQPTKGRGLLQWPPPVIGEVPDVDEPTTIGIATPAKPVNVDPIGQALLVNEPTIGSVNQALIGADRRGLLQSGIAVDPIGEVPDIATPAKPVNVDPIGQALLGLATPAKVDALGNVLAINEPAVDPIGEVPDIATPAKKGNRRLLK